MSGRRVPGSGYSSPAPGDGETTRGSEVVQGAGVAPDLAMCAACRAEVRDPFSRRYRYPFTSCDACGPRFSISRSAPAERLNTSLRDFALCPACRAERADPASRREHTPASACFACGPRAKLERADGRAFPPDRYSMMDEVDAVGSLLLHGEIVAIKGAGGYHLCCDATNAEAVAELRRRKRRPSSPFALMARDLEVVAEHAELDDAARALLESGTAPIVLLPRRDGAATPVVEAVAPNLRELGFMLPLSPLHELALIRVGRPIVCTSANLRGEPRVIDDAVARTRLGGRDGDSPAIADWLLTHDRPIINRVDDSVARVVSSRTRVLRRARGYAPASLPLPPGLEGSSPVLALGGERDAAVALGFPGEVLLSHHLGDLGDPNTFSAWQDALDRLTHLWHHRPAACAVTRHQRSRTTEVGRGIARARQLALVPVQRQHAQLAAVLAEHGIPHTPGAPVLGFALGGLGVGDDFEGASATPPVRWGGELIAFDYLSFTRLATFKPVPLLDEPRRHPWRSLYAHLRSTFSLAELQRDYGDAPFLRLFESKQADELSGAEDGAMDGTLLASSASRLFDAVAAAVGASVGAPFAEEISYDGHAARALSALVTPAALAQARAEADRREVYPVGFPRLPGVAGQGPSGMSYFEWRGMWNAILGDLAVETAPALVAARFFVGIAEALRLAAARNRDAHLERGGRDLVALTGECFESPALLEEAERRLGADGWTVLSPALLPPNEGALAFGQVVVAAAQLRAEAATRPPLESAPSQESH